MEKYRKLQAGNFDWDPTRRILMTNVEQNRIGERVEGKKTNFLCERKLLPET